MKPRFTFKKKATGKKTVRKPFLPGLDKSKAFLAIGSVIILSALLSFQLLPSKVNLKLGDKSPRAITSPRSERYLDKFETDLRKDQAIASVPTQYDPVPDASNRAFSALKTIFNTIEDTRLKSNGFTISQKVFSVKNNLGLILSGYLSDKSLSYLLTTEPNTLRTIEDNALRILSAKMDEEIKEDPSAMRIVRANILKEAKNLLNNQMMSGAVAELVQEAIRPNRISSIERTKALQETVVKAVQPVYREINRGEVLINKDDVVMREHLEKFAAVGLLKPGFDFKTALSLTLFVILAVTLVTGYIHRNHPDIFSSMKSLYLLAIIIIVSTFFLRMSGSVPGIPFTPELSGYLGIMWVITSGMVISALLNPQLAVVVSSLLAMVLSITLNNELKYAAGALMCAYVGIYSVSNIRGRTDFMRAAGLVAATGVMLTWIIGVISGDELSILISGTVWTGVFIPLGATALFFLGSMVLERPFGRTTHITLLELADTNHPILKRMVVEAPGTYTHSALVGFLAESAAEAIGADSLLARVSSYYHDIGKLQRPHFFIENQNVENAHDNINPTLSALVITSHIKDGLETAKEYKLPQVIQDIISQHHGTQLVQYFYNQCTNEHDESAALEHQFRYPGPKPQNKEAVIVMLADSVEAASRSLDKPTHAKIEYLVNRVIADKLRDGQLDESDLTFREVTKISEIFIKGLLSTMHARIEYPEVQEAKKQIADTTTEQSEDTAETENADKLSEIGSGS